MYDSIATSNVNLTSLKQIFKEFKKDEPNKNEDIFPNLAKDFESPLRGFKVYTDDYLCHTETWTGRWLVEGNEFFTYWDGKGEPPSWAIYCGFVKKEMKRPAGYLFDNRRMHLIANACF